MFRAFPILALAAALAACGQSPAPRERKGPVIALSDRIFDTGGTDTVRFGRLHSGEIAVLHLWIDNRASRPAVITSYERTCGCTTLEFEPQPLAPGNARRVSLTFDSRGLRGWQLKALDLKLAGAAHPLRLFVEAEVE